MDHEQKKTFDNTSSSYLSLKAELLRKKQDIQRASSASISSTSILDNLQSSSSSLKLKANADLDIQVANPSKKKKKNDEKPPASPTPVSTSSISREDEMAFAKSRAILEAKSKLYDEIMSNNEMKLLAEDNDDDDDDKSFLVNFEQKIYETNQNKKQMEYTDSFGRTRLVTPDEYEHLKASEKKTSHEKTSSNTTENEINRVERLHREQMRSKWESEMDALRNKTQVHYEDVLFDEKREHGVGYYKFSTDDKRRSEQMETLNELRTNTKTEQRKFTEGKEKRHSNMAERLNKIRLRKAKEMGINLSENETVPTAEDIDKSQMKSDNQNLLNSVNDTREKLPEKVSTDKTKDFKSSDVPASQLSEQKIQTVRTQPSSLLPSNQQTPQNSDPSFAYPFPVMRSGNVS